MGNNLVHAGILAKEDGGFERAERRIEQWSIDGVTVTHVFSEDESKIKGELSGPIEGYTRFFLGKESPVYLAIRYEIRKEIDEMLITSLVVVGEPWKIGAKSIGETKIPEAVIAVADRHGKKEVRVSKSVAGSHLVASELEKTRSSFDKDKRKQLPGVR